LGPPADVGLPHLRRAGATRAGQRPRKRLHLYGQCPSVPSEVDPPNLIAIVQLDEQDDLRIMTNIVGCDPGAVRCGLPVQVLFERHDEVFYPLFAPDGGEA